MSTKTTQTKQKMLQQSFPSNSLSFPCHRFCVVVRACVPTKRAERDAVAAGKKPFHLKRSEKKRLELEQRYEQLASEGKLEKFMEKRRKKNSKKDKRWLPTR